MDKIYLITVQDVKNITSVQNNVDEKYIKNSILIAQDIELQRILGTYLYEKILDQVKNNNLSTANTTLISQLKKCLTYYSLYYSLSEQWVRNTEIGLVQKQTENATSIDYNTFDKLRSGYRSIAEEYENFLKNFIMKNINDYQLYGDDAYDITGDTTNSFFSGIVFKKKSYYKRNCGCDD